MVSLLFKMFYEKLVMEMVQIVVELLVLSDEKLLSFLEMGLILFPVQFIFQEFIRLVQVILLFLVLLPLFIILKEFLLVILLQNFLQILLHILENHKKCHLIHSKEMEV